MPTIRFCQNRAGMAIPAPAPYVISTGARTRSGAERRRRASHVVISTGARTRSGAERRRRASHVVISTGAVRSTAEWRNLVPMGREVSPLRACGAPVEMTSGGEAAWMSGSSPLLSAHDFGADSPLVISTDSGLDPGGAVRSTAAPLRHFDRSRAAARRSGETSSPWGREVSPLRASRSGRNDEGGVACGAGRFLHSALRAPVEMTRGCPWGREVSPLRACGAPVEMTKGALPTSSGPSG